MLYLKYGFRMNEITLREWVREVGGGKAAAELAGVSEVSIWKYLSGERRPSPEVAARIERVSDGAVRKERLIWPSERAA